MSDETTKPTQDLPLEDHETLRERFYAMVRRQLGRYELKPAAKQKLKDDERSATRERLEKAGDDVVLEVHEIDHETRTVLRLKDSPLDRLAFGAKPKITGDQYNAGVRYYTDAYKAGMMPSGVIDPSKERVDGGQYKDIADAKIAAQTRFEHALRAITFRDVSVLDAMVIQEIPLSEYAERFTRHKKRIIRQGIALELLCHALDALDRHYNPPRRGRGIAGELQDGYRPRITPSHEV